MKELELKGCRTEPFGSYLKALGVLRILYSQTGKEGGVARGWWEGDTFKIRSGFDRSSLTDFFVSRYCPTPIITPWNGGSGFYPKDSKVEIDSILKSSDARLNGFKTAISEVLSWGLINSNSTVQQMLDYVKDENSGYDLSAVQKEVVQNPNLKTTALSNLGKQPDGVRKLVTEFYRIQREIGKKKMVNLCRARLSDDVVDWIDASVVMVDDAGRGKELAFPPIFIAGGGEGHLNYSMQFMRAILEILKSKHSEELFRNAVFEEPTNHLGKFKAGYFFPFRAGGNNQGLGIANDDPPVNPWDIILALEGAIVWAGGIGRRLSSKKKTNDNAGILTSPFTVKHVRGAFERDLNDKDSSRGEIWFPIWDRPTGYLELKAFLSEGRAQIGRRHARNTIEIAEAITSLGVDRGIKEFIPYSLLERRGKGYYIAMTSERFRAEKRRDSELIEELRRLLAPIESIDKKPKELEARIRGMYKDAYRTLQTDDRHYVKLLVESIGETVELLSKRPGIKLWKAFWGLSPDWIKRADDGSAEVRLAASLASTHVISNAAEKAMSVKRKETSMILGSGTAITQRITSVFKHEMVVGLGEARPNKSRFEAFLGDVASFIDGSVDEKALENLILGFSIINWKIDKSKEEKRAEFEQKNEPTNDVVPLAYAIPKLLFVRDGYSENDRLVKNRSARQLKIVSLIENGSVGTACEIAKTGLRALGHEPIDIKLEDGSDGDRIAAALFFPITKGGVEKLRKKVLKKGRGASHESIVGIL